MSRAAIQTLSCSVRLSARTTLSLAPPRFPGFRYHTTFFLSASRMSGFPSPSTSATATPDILLADKKQFVWYRNPGKRGVAWDKFVLAKNLTEHDNVCI